MTLTITRFVPTTDSTNVLAFFDAELDFGQAMRVTLYGLKLVQAKDLSTFVASSTRKGNNDKYYANYLVTAPIQDELHTLATAKLPVTDEVPA